MVNYDPRNWLGVLAQAHGSVMPRFPVCRGRSPFWGGFPRWAGTFPRVPGKIALWGGFPRWAGPFPRMPGKIAFLGRLSPLGGAASPGAGEDRPLRLRGLPQLGAGFSRAAECPPEARSCWAGISSR